MRTGKLRAVPSSSTTEPAHASWHHPADHPHPRPGWRSADLGLEPELGLGPERRAGSDRRDPDHPLAHGPPLRADRITKQTKGAEQAPFSRQHVVSSAGVLEGRGVPKLIFVHVETAWSG